MKLDPHKVRRARELLAMSTGAAAGAAGVSEAAYLRAEHGKGIQPGTARKIAAGLQVTVPDLYPDPQADDGEPVRDPEPTLELQHMFAMAAPARQRALEAATPQEVAEYHEYMTLYADTVRATLAKETRPAMQEQVERYLRRMEQLRDEAAAYAPRSQDGATA